MEGASLFDRRVQDLLDEVASESLLPGAGSAAAIAAALAAGVAASVAKLSQAEAGDADVAIKRAEELGAHLALLADANASAYEEATRSLGRDPSADEVRDARLGSDLALAAYTPLSVAEVAADVAALAAVLAEGGNPEVRPDAVVAACLAEAAARGAAHLVRVNLGTVPGDERVALAEGFADAAAGARDRALGAAGPV